MARCPAHDDKKESLSIRVNDDGKILLNCFAGCASGEIVSALGLEMRHLFAKDSKPKKSGGFGEIVQAYSYEDEEQNEVFQVVRMVPKDFRQRAAKPEGGWNWSTKDILKPLFRLPQVMAAINGTPQRKVFIVEGEKDVLSLEKLGMTATTNPGGSSVKWPQRYSKILNQTTCILIPDQDEPGRKHMKKIAKTLKDCVTIELPGSKKGGDISDWIRAGGGREDLIQIVDDALEERDHKPEPLPDSNNPFYTPLGHLDQSYYFLSTRVKGVVELKSATLRSDGHLLALAPLLYWEDQYPLEKSGFDKLRVMDALVQQSVDIPGTYDARKVRGRGAWLDDGRTVLHAGTRLIVDGEEKPIMDRSFKTGYIYPMKQSMHVPMGQPLSDEDGMKLIQLYERLPFADEWGVIALSGWTALAPICGVLDWRPHIWLTGPSGSGKTWIVEYIIKKMLGQMAVHVQGASTEAGLRQILGQDALPVLFDEAEMEDQHSQMNIQKVLELARQASSDGGGVITKGSRDGTPQIFSIRSMFMLSSVTVGLHRKADESRMTLIQLERPADADSEKAEKFAVTEKLAAKLNNSEYLAGLVSRMVMLAPVVKKNAKVFGLAIASVLGSRRLGDQFGALLAGNWALWSKEEIDLERACEVVDRMGLESQSSAMSTVTGSEEARCLGHILQAQVAVEKPHVGQVKRTIGELIEAATRERGDVPMAICEDTLKRYGIKVDAEGVKISNTHRGIAGLLFQTPWAVGWGNILQRLQHGTQQKKPERFPGGVVSKVVSIGWEDVNSDNVQ